MTREYIEQYLKFPDVIYFTLGLIFFNLMAFLLFSFGIYTQYQFFQKLKYRDIIQPTELKVESYYSTGSSGDAPSNTLRVTGYVGDSVSVSIKISKKDKRRVEKDNGNISVWYDPVNEDIFLRTPEDNGTKFSIAIWSWYHFKWSLALMLPQIFMIIFLKKVYKVYKE